LTIEYINRGPKINLWALFLIFPLVVVFILANFTILFDDNLSPDHRNYANTWIRGWQGIPWPESLYSLTGMLFSGVDFRWFFLVLNSVSVVSIATYKTLPITSRAAFLAFLLSSPFTLHGMGGSYLSYTAELVFCACLLRYRPWLSLVGAMWIHKGAAFLTPLIFLKDIKKLSGVIFIVTTFAALAVYLGPLNYLIDFEVSIAAIVALSTVVTIPYILLGALRRSQRQCVAGIMLFVWIILLWTILPKLGNRVGFFVAIPILLLSSAELVHLRKWLNKLAYVSIILATNIAGIFMSSALERF
jgi:hypothetical protein